MASFDDSRGRLPRSDTSRSRSGWDSSPEKSASRWPRSTSSSGAARRERFSSSVTAARRTTVASQSDGVLLTLFKVDLTRDRGQTGVVRMLMYLGSHEARDGRTVPDGAPDEIARLVRCEPPRPPVAAHWESVPHPRRGVSLAAHSDRERHSLLRAVPPQIPDGPESRGRPAR